MSGPRFEDSFCGTISELASALDYNGIHNVTMYDASLTALKNLPGPFGLIYGFYTIGYHWSLEHFFDEIIGLMAKDGTAIFTVTDDFTPFAELQQVPHRIVEKNRIDYGKEKLLILRNRLNDQRVSAKR
jgi:hypothetical protein